MNINNNINAIIPAAGIGHRMQLDYPKQYLTIKGKTIIEHSISVLLQHPLIQNIIIVIDCKDSWFKLLPIASNRRIKTIIIENKSNRANSVMAGLQEQTINNKQQNNNDWILIHDAVRPCLLYDDLEQLLSVRARSPVGAILVTPVRDTIKRSYLHKPLISYTIKRKDLWHALTPQLFPRRLLYNCMRYTFNKGKIFTDESSVLEYCGYHPTLVVGHHNNIKITYQEDIKLAEFYILNQQINEDKK
ncbi:MAG: 2-C-methyl-D-erythritol 4-phosphate cytidylyltransferase [Candidatus Dasytiphilus stammeri]